MYCVATNTNMKDVLVDILDKFLKSEGFLEESGKGENTIGE